VTLIHGGLRLREGYMAIHRRQLESYAATGRSVEFETYARCLLDSFGPAYMEHLRRWLDADGIALPPAAREAVLDPA